MVNIQMYYYDGSQYINLYPKVNGYTVNSFYGSYIGTGTQSIDITINTFTGKAFLIYISFGLNGYSSVLDSRYSSSDVWFQEFSKKTSLNATSLDKFYVISTNIEVISGTLSIFQDGAGWDILTNSQVSNIHTKSGLNATNVKYNYYIYYLN